MHSPCGHGLLNKFDSSPLKERITCHLCGKEAWINVDSLLARRGRAEWGGLNWQYYYCGWQCRDENIESFGLDNT